MIRIGIYGVSTQSGKAYLADLLSMGVQVYGYARASEHGREVVEAIRRQGGVELRRPPNDIEPTARFVPLGDSVVGHDLGALLERSDAILFAHPSSYHEETARELRDAGLALRRIPLILSPSRTLATPYLWQILGEGYPIVAFPTCPYSCKSPAPGVTFIKRRKRSWFAAAEGQTSSRILAALKDLFPQMVFSDVPATTSLGNIGAIFHPTAYMLNRDAILAAAARGETFSFYVEGIVQNPDVAAVVGEIDQIRLRIAAQAGISVFGLDGNPREEDWAPIMARLASLEAITNLGVRETRCLRAQYLKPISDSVVSAQHWLDYTYGVQRVPGGSLVDAIARTPTYQERSYPQERYVYEDIPTGLVPFEALARRFGIPHEPITRVIDLYAAVAGGDPRAEGRNLEAFDDEYLLGYLAEGTRAAAEPLRAAS